jgi:hypothetical protein
MEANFTIKKNGQEFMTADKLNWISYLGKDKVGKKIETAPAVNYAMALDLQVADINSLDLANLKKAQIKSTSTFTSPLITSVVESSREYVKFECGEDVFEVLIRINTTPKPRTSPVGPAM